jgi:hypothetical protein
MKNTTHDLAAIAIELNAVLAAAVRDERWEIDSDTFSNSVGTWFCGTLGGVTDEATMREETARLLKPI